MRVLFCCQGISQPLERTELYDTTFIMHEPVPNFCLVARSMRPCWPVKQTMRRSISSKLFLSVGSGKLSAGLHGVQLMLFRINSDRSFGDVHAQGFQGEFLWQGTADVSAWLAVPAALRVMRTVGMDAWRQHNSSLLRDAVSLLSRALNTDHVIGEDIASTPHPLDALPMVDTYLPPCTRW